MDAQLRVETGSFVARGVDASYARGEEDAVHETAAQRDERERRRIEFRRSLDQARIQARALLMRVDGRAKTQDCVAQASAETCEPRGMRMELVPAR